LPKVEDLSTTQVNKINFPSSQTHILMGNPGVKQGDPDFYALYVGNHVLGGNGSVTRLFDVIRNKHGLAYSVYSYFGPMRERGPFVVGCQTRNDQADNALKLMENVLKDFITEGPNPKELEEAKQNLLGGYALQFDSNASICQQVASLAFYGLPLDYFNQFKVEIEKVTAEDVKKAFAKHVSPDKLAVVMVGSEKVQSPAVPMDAPSSHHGM
jgi:zinc protease